MTFKPRRSKIEFDVWLFGVAVMLRLKIKSEGERQDICMLPVERSELETEGRSEGEQLDLCSLSKGCGKLLSLEILDFQS